jgi:hypothetical protein
MTADLEWHEVPAGLKEEFCNRMARMLPELDPQVEWENMTPQGRRDTCWHLERQPWALSDSWAEECERIRAMADEATGQAFRMLADLDQSC